MPNKHVIQRLTGLQNILNGVHQSNSSMSSVTKGEERAAFVDQFLSKVLPPLYRFGSGDVTDAKGDRSGQLDVVIEYPFSPSLPMVGAGQTRLYLAESVAAVVEVKSDLSNQWAQAEKTREALAPIHRTFGASMSFGPAPSKSIPLFAVGYTGWNNLSTLKSKIDASEAIFGALVIDQGVYYSKRGISVPYGPWSLWGLIIDLHVITNSLQSAQSDPAVYAK